MNAPAKLVGFVLVVAALVIGTSSAVIVDATEHVVVTQFGKPTAVHSEPGLYLKLPAPLQRAARFDRRVLHTETRETELLTSDKKNVMVSAYISWKISEPLDYLAALRTRDAAEVRLRALAQSELGSALGNAAFSDIVSADEGGSGLSELADAVEERCRTVAKRDFGIDITDLGITRLNFPAQNLQSVFGRMRAERGKIARAYRSEGRADAAKIQAVADRKRSQELATAKAEAKRLRGEGEAAAARIYAEAYKGHEDFYRFTRTLETYEKILDEKTTLILPSDAPLFDLLMSRAGNDTPRKRGATD